MIRFFRQIRQKLLDDNKVSKYFIYASGEIFLVVIGILIALQINNWNEDRKNRAIERSMLLEYQEELRFNFEELKSGIESMEGRANSCFVLLKVIEEEHPYHDSLANHFKVLTESLGGNLSHVAFKSIEDNGLKTITNNDLKKQVQNLHAHQYNQLSIRTQNQISNIQEFGRPIVRHQLKAIGGGRYVPINYKELMSQVSVWNILTVLKGNYVNLREIMERTQAEITKIDELIERELQE